MIKDTKLKADDLLVGNLIYETKYSFEHLKNITEVVTVTPNIITMFSMGLSDCFSGIPLKQGIISWLDYPNGIIDLTDTAYTRYIHLDSLGDVSFNSEPNYKEEHHETELPHIKYLHQLQNLVKILTGSPLNVNIK